VWLHAEDVGARLVVRSYLADRQTTERFLGPGWDVPFTERVKPNSLGFGTGSIGRLSGPTTPPVLLYRDQHLLAPWWFLMLASAALPAARMTRVIAQRRTAAAKLREGRCLRCGYDLRATPDRCPECGARSAAPTAA
jgi:hypothetical protein